MLKHFSINTRFLLSLSLIFAGIIVLAFIIFDSQQKTKTQITTLYFGSLVPIKDLQRIVIILNKEITLRTFLARIYAEDETLSQSLLDSDEEIARLWKAYATKWKSDAEKPYIEYVDNEMYKFHNYLVELSSLISSVSDNNQISLDSLRKTVSHIESHMNNLIGHETNAAHNDRIDFIEKHENKSWILALVVLFILIVTLLLFLNIQSLQNKLHQATKDLHKESITDGLTGLYNRRYFDQIFATELKRSKREGCHVAFMMLDIDHFKKYNDTYGHAKGDDVIKSVAKHLQEHFRRSEDLIFRLGGEEFGVLLHSQSYEDIKVLSTGMIEGMEGLAIEHKASDTRPYLTLSMGVLYLDCVHDVDVEKIYSLTDEQLYLAKEEGRNQVRFKEFMT